MTRRCYGNPAQYERNRRFRHLVHMLGRSATGVRLPSVRLWLNASKSESRPDMRRYIYSPLRREATIWRRWGLAPRRLVEPRQEVFTVPPISAGGSLNTIHPMRRGGDKSFVDDLVLGRGVVISRAATSLRSVETQPWTRRFVRTRRASISDYGLRRPQQTQPRGALLLLIRALLCLSHCLSGAVEVVIRALLCLSHCLSGAVEVDVAF